MHQPTPNNPRDLQNFGSIFPTLGSSAFFGFPPTPCPLRNASILTRLPGSVALTVTQAIIANGFVYTAGQTAVDPTTNKIVEDDVRVQTRRVLDNITIVLKAANTSLERVVKTTVFLRDMNDFAAMNEEYANVRWGSLIYHVMRYFPGNKPARTTVQVARLPGDVTVEIETIALI
ncbi:Endoribonuclease L-PSP/chorismate mutase-like protein [Endogone sp. FLAS-F59071]|nr:Endoribonuclease L-PSP/chorismate mutase-like protein [Endogone sp. FLAS-F59071]|eukprot:RUS18642.1 Endoribonuclease L-PSP/chorismate mutase-like protein [Endogone sp. FLAS-F59071]